jgi:hypothetical protein
LPWRLEVGDVSVIHPAAVPYAAVAVLASVLAAAARNSAKQRAYRTFSSALLFVPMLMESFGTPAMSLLESFAGSAVLAGGPGLSRSAFISGALRELSVALCRGNAFLCRSDWYAVKAAASQAPVRRQSRPSTEVALCCRAC